MHDPRERPTLRLPAPRRNSIVSRSHMCICGRNARTQHNASTVHARAKERVEKSAVSNQTTRTQRPQRTPFRPCAHSCVAATVSATVAPVSPLSAISSVPLFDRRAVFFFRQRTRVNAAAPVCEHASAGSSSLLALPRANLRLSATLCHACTLDPCCFSCASIRVLTLRTQAAHTRQRARDGRWRVNVGIFAAGLACHKDCRVCARPTTCQEYEQRRAKAP